MKKIVFIIICLIVFTPRLYASCEYQDARMLNTFAGYVDYSYVYNEETSSFDISIYNVNEYLFIGDNNGVTYFADINNEIHLKSKLEGEKTEFLVYARLIDGCTGKKLRTIRITLPYKNPYYESNECVNNMDKVVCYSKFLSYKITEKIFKQAINPITFSKNYEVIIRDNSFSFDQLKEFLYNYWLGILISLVATSISVLIGNKVYRKVKHGL